MTEFYQTPLDVLYFTLTVVSGLLGLFLILAVYHLVRILKNVRTVTEKTKDTMDLINHYLWQPLKIMMKLMEYGKEYAAEAMKKKEKKAEKRKK